MDYAYWPLNWDDGFDVNNYGSVQVELSPDGQTRFVRADRIAAIPISLLADRSFHLETEDGYLVVDKDHVYMPVSVAEDGRIVVCERVRRSLPPQTYWRRGISAGA